MEKKSLEELLRDGTLTNPGDVRLAQGKCELPGIDDPLNHPIALTQLLACEAMECDGAVLAAAALHDTVEDTDTTLEELESAFGRRVANIVREVTDDKTLDKAERKLLQIEHAAHASKSAKAVKLADKICNLRDLTKSPPADWSVERRREYFDWAKRVVEAMRGSYPFLERLFDAEYARRP